MTLSGHGIGSVVMVEAGSPIVMVPVRGAGLGEQVGDYGDTFWTYGSIDTAMDDVNDHVLALSADVSTHLTEVMGTADGGRFYADWVTYRAQWIAFYANNRHSLSGWGQAAIGGLQNSIRLFASRYNGLESRYRALGFTPTTVGSPHPGNVLPTEAWVGIGIGAGLIALGLTAWIVSSASKYAPAANAVATRATRGRRR